MNKQIFGWTGPTPESGKYAQYIMAFDVSGRAVRVEVRNPDSSIGTIIIPREVAVALAEALSR